jgi:hypothetical protein
MAGKQVDFKCIGDHCCSRLACHAFGYCRERNFDGKGMSKQECERRKRESDQEGKEHG